MSKRDITCADLLDEYGSALRGSWADIDGRSEEGSLAVLSEAFRTYGNDRLLPPDIERLRESLDVCPFGYAHWTEFCDKDCTEVSA